MKDERVSDFWYEQGIGLGTCVDTYRPTYLRLFLQKKKKL
jgi:hypothetical protein